MTASKQARKSTLLHGVTASKAIILLLVACAGMIVSPAQTLTTLVDFNPSTGFAPYVGLVQGTDGNFYGTTFYGGSSQYCGGDGCGTVFRISPTLPYTLTTIYNFCSQANCTDGLHPDAPLIQATDGNFYGTTAANENNGGVQTVFKITPSGILTTLHTFCSPYPNCPDGLGPEGLVQGTDGNFYGTTAEGANGYGTVFKITPEGSFTILYTFCSQPSCADGATPGGALAQGTDGNFYGATVLGGAYGEGTVFKITPFGTLTTLVSVLGYPSGALVQGTDGNFYGTTGHAGTIFQVTPQGVLTTLGTVCCYPYAGVIQGNDGNLYGTTFTGGLNNNDNYCQNNGCGSVFEVTLPGHVVAPPLYSFCNEPNCTDGYGPIAGLVQGTDGKLYGTTNGGGTGGICDDYPSCGTVFSLDVGLGPFVETRPTSGYRGSPVTILGTNLTGATSVTFNGTSAPILTNTGSAITTTVPAGATTGPVQVQTSGGPLTSNVNFQVTPAPTFSVLHSFTGEGDGAVPSAGVSIDAAGNLYGTTLEGGDLACNQAPQGCGTVYKLQHRGTGWTLNPLYTFTGGNDGASPAARVVFGPNGALFGTTSFGGHSGVFSGVVFKLTSSPTICRTVLCPWRETTLYEFTGGADGARPAYGDVTFDHAGNMYGTALYGGYSSPACPFGCGVVWELTPPGSWTSESVLHAFTNSPDGSGPANSVIFDNAGNLYGTTYLGGSGGYGTAFQLTPAGPPWTENVLYDFQDGSDGGAVDAGLIIDGSGNLYGAAGAGPGGGGGTVIELSPMGTGYTFAVLNSFTWTGTTCGTGAPPGPDATLAMDEAGNLYGTTCAEGLYGFGNVFRLTPFDGGWAYTDLYDFTGGSDGKFPVSNVSFDSDGNLYGTASAGGIAGSCSGSGCGVVWETTP